MRFILEPKDALGRYVIQATLTDRIAGKSLQLTETLDAVEETPPTAAPTS